MLNVFSTWNGEPCALLLGGFDGFHNGHRTLLRAAQETGLPVGLTTIVGNKSGGDIFTLQERRTIFGEEGFDFVQEWEFAEIKNITALDFLTSLFDVLPVRAVFCGEDFRFGKGAIGTTQLLKEVAPCPVSVIALKEEGGEKLAVTKMKKLVSSGNMRALSRSFGYDYFIQGEVVHGRQTGRRYGFPTINVPFPQEKYPLKDGVYGGYVETPDGTFSAIVNVGACPTFGIEERAVEAHLIGFSGELYGDEVRVRLKEYLRPIRKFESAEALKIQLQQDKARLEVLF